MEKEAKQIRSKIFHVILYIKNDTQGFILYPDTEKWVEKRGVAELLKTDFEVSGYRMKH